MKKVAFKKLWNLQVVTEETTFFSYDVEREPAGLFHSVSDISAQRG